MYDTLLNTMDILSTTLLMICACFSVAVLHVLIKMKKKTRLLIIKEDVFSLLNPGMIALAAAFFVLNGDRLMGRSHFPSVADIFFIMAYLLIAAAFGYFWYSSAKLHKLHIKEPIFMFGVVCGVFIWLYYLFVMHIIPGNAGQPLIAKLLDYFYPIIVSLIFIMTLIVHPRMKAGLIRTPLWYISAGVFTYFIAFMMKAYAAYSMTIDFMPVIYAAFFLISALYFTLGFYAANKKYSPLK